MASNETNRPVEFVSTRSAQQPQPVIHPDKDEIIRQVEFYFGDENLPKDRHLLGLTGGDGNGPVSLSEILSFNKMRAYKPIPAVIEALRQSDFCEIVADGKKIQRRHPLTKPILVEPRINRNKQKKTPPADKPWLTKGMLKPTGFEENATEGPLKPEEYEEERKLYDPDESFISRIEVAINRFNARRKMHQTTRNIFEKFMIFGGIEGGQRQFGGSDKKQLVKEGYDKEDIERMTANYAVSKRVVDAFFEEDETDGAVYVVDFEALAKGFLSSVFPTSFAWYEEDQIKTVTNVLRNFYNYLTVHNVCPEFSEQLVAARRICDRAEEELMKMRLADRSLPGGFNTACSVLYQGSLAGLYRPEATNDGWHTATDGEENVGWSNRDALMVLRAGVMAHGTPDQVEKFLAASTKGAEAEPPRLRTIYEEKLGLEIERIEYASKEAKAIYEYSGFAGTYVRPTGKLHCIRWEIPFAEPTDLPPSATEIDGTKKFEFLVDEDILKDCYPGMKMEAVVRELDLGIMWLDRVEVTYPSFFTWLANERIREWKEPGEPKAWMLRQLAKKNGREGASDGGADDDGDGGDDPD